MDSPSRHPKPTVTDRRAAQREALIAAAELRISETGVGSLRARELAQDIGVAVGAIYNLVSDLDDLAFLVGARTLGRLDAVLEAAADRAAAGPGGATEELVAIACAYLGFAQANMRLWRAVFSLSARPDQELPDWMSVERKRMFRHILRPLESLLPDAQPHERELFAHTLFTATHGIVQLGLEQRLFAVPASDIEGQLVMLVRAVCRGLESR